MINEVVTRLKADATFSGLCAGRLFPVSTDDPVYPLALFRTSSSEEMVASGLTGSGEVTFFFESHDFSYTTAKAVDAAIRASLNGFSGAMGAKTVKSAFASESVDGGERREDGKHMTIIRMSVKVAYE